MGQKLFCFCLVYKSCQWCYLWQKYILQGQENLWERVVSLVFLMTAVFLRTVVTTVASGEDPSLFRSRLDAVKFPDAFQLLEDSVWSASVHCLVTFWGNIKEYSMSETHCFGSWCKCKGCWSGKILLKILFCVFSIPNDSCLSKNCMAHLLFDISSSSILLPLCMRCFEKRITVHLKSSLNLLSSACMQLWGLLLLIHWTDWCRILMQKYKTVVNLMWYKWLRDGHSEILKCKKYKNI